LETGFFAPSDVLLDLFRSLDCEDLLAGALFNNRMSLEPPSGALFNNRTSCLSLLLCTYDMPPPKQPTCGQQPASISGLGVAFSSPVKRSEKRKTTAYVLPLGRDTKRRRLQEKLRLLQSGQSAVSNPGSRLCPDNSDAALDVPIPLDQLPDLPDDPLPLDLPKTRRILPDRSAYSLYTKWSQVIPTLTQPFLSYIATSTGTATQPPSSLQSKCMAECFRKSYTILCLFQDRESSPFYTLTTFQHSVS
jgi:hypothetical protein